MSAQVEVKGTFEFINASDSYIEDYTFNGQSGKIAQKDSVSIDFSVPDDSNILFTLKLEGVTETLNMMLHVTASESRCDFILSSGWANKQINGNNVCTSSGSMHQFTIPIINPIGILIVGTTDPVIPPHK